MNELSPIDKIPGIIQAAVYEDDPEIAFNEIKKLNELSEMVEDAKGIFIYEMSKVWDQFSISKSESLQTQAYLYLKWHPHTIDRYMTVAKIDPQLPEKIQDKPLRERAPIAKAVAQGYEITKKQWKDLESSELSGVYETLREVRNQKPRKGSLQNYVDEEGNVYCWYNQERFAVGYLDVTNKSEAVQKAIKRIIDSSGIIRK